MPPSRFPWTHLLLVRSEPRAWVYLFAMLIGAVGLAIIAVRNPGAHWQWSCWVIAVWFVLNAGYGAFCVVWHRRHRGSP